MKVNIEDLEKSIKWLKENTNAVSVEVYVSHDRHFKIKSEDRSSRIVEITLYSIDKNQRSLLKPTVQKTELL